MSHVVITGAAGFVGAALARRLMQEVNALGRPIRRLTLVDQAFSTLPEQAGVAAFVGDFADARLLDAFSADPPDLLFHLASVPGALAERDYALGYRVNVAGTFALCQHLAGIGRAGKRIPRIVFGSSVAVYGPRSDAISEDDIPAPALSYGAHKWMTEILLADLARRGEIEAVSLRLPGIIARPETESGHGSAFMSLIFRRLVASASYVCPVPPDATAWWMSLPCCLDNLLHAARLPGDASLSSRVWQLPVLHLGVGEVIGEAAQQYAVDASRLITHQVDEGITALFGRSLALSTPKAEAAGFRHDGTCSALVARAI